METHLREGTPVYSYLTITGWHGSTSTLVMTVGMTAKRFRIRALTRTRLAGRNRWLEPGEETLVPKTAITHGPVGTDAEVCKAMGAAQTAMDAAEKVVEAHFMSRLRAAIAAGEREAAVAIVRAMPDCVTRVFGMDALRQAGWSLRG